MLTISPAVLPGTIAFPMLAGSVLLAVGLGVARVSASRQATYRWGEEGLAVVPVLIVYLFSVWAWRPGHTALSRDFDPGDVANRAILMAEAISDHMQADAWSSVWMVAVSSLGGLGLLLLLLGRRRYQLSPRVAVGASLLVYSLLAQAAGGWLWVSTWPAGLAAAADADLGQRAIPIKSAFLEARWALDGAHRTALCIALVGGVLIASGIASLRISSRRCWLLAALFSLLTATVAWVSWPLYRENSMPIPSASEGQHQTFDGTTLPLRGPEPLPAGIILSLDRDGMKLMGRAFRGDGQLSDQLAQLRRTEELMMHFTGRLGLACAGDVSLQKVHEVLQVADRVGFDNPHFVFETLGPVQDRPILGRRQSVEQTSLPVLWTAPSSDSHCVDGKLRLRDVATQWTEQAAAGEPVVVCVHRKPGGLRGLLQRLFNQP